MKRAAFHAWIPSELIFSWAESLCNKLLNMKLEQIFSWSKKVFQSGTNQCLLWNDTDPDFNFKWLSMLVSARKPQTSLEWTIQQYLLVISEYNEMNTISEYKIDTYRFKPFFLRNPSNRNNTFGIYASHIKYQSPVNHQ